MDSYNVSLTSCSNENAYTFASDCFDLGELMAKYFITCYS